MKNETDEILLALEDKEPEKKPKKGAHKIALFFADMIFFFLDVGSGLGVYWLTDIWYYGVIVFLAGFVPLMLHQKLYTQPYASKDQKNAAMVGGILAVGSVLIVAIFIAIVNFVAKAASGNAILWMEGGLAASLVLLAFAHAIITAYYFYIDEETAEEQNTSRIIARGERGVTRIRAAGKVARAKRSEVAERHTLEGQFSPEVISKIVQMLKDDDGDGIPNFLDPVDNRKRQAFASTAPKPGELKVTSENPTRRE